LEQPVVWLMRYVTPYVLAFDQLIVPLRETHCKWGKYIDYANPAHWAEEGKGHGTLGLHLVFEIFRNQS
jgi:hypothetical protein